MRKYLLLLSSLILLCASGAKAQGVRYQLSPPAPNAQVYVCPSPDGGYPCPTQQAIYSDSALTQVIAQPANLGSGGFFSFYVAAGTYTIQLAGPGYNSSNRQVVTIGSAGGSGVSKGLVDASTGGFGVFANTKFIMDPTWVISGPGVTVTCATSNDCNFVAGDVGKVCFGTNVTTDVSAIATIVTLTQGTITTVNSAQSAVCSGTASANATASGMFVWGSLDTATAAQTQSTANDPLYSAWSNAATACKYLHISGIMLAEQGEFNIAPATPCNGQNSLTYTRQGYGVVGDGETSTIIFLTPSFKAASCAPGCFLSAPSMFANGFQINGAGNSAIGAGFAAKSGVLMAGLSPGVNFKMSNILLYGWGANTAGFKGVNVGNDVANGVSNGVFTNVQRESFGNTIQYVGAQAGALITDEGGNMAACVSYCELVNSGTVVNVGTTYGFSPASAAVSNVVVQGASVFTDLGGNMPYASGTSQAAFTFTGTSLGKLIGTYVNNTGTTSYAVSTGAGVSVHATGSYLKGTTGSVALASNTFFDDCGNTFNGTSGSQLIGDCSITGVAQTNANIGMTSGWGTANVNTVSGNTRRQQFTVSVTGGVPTASPVLTINHPTTFLGTPPICGIQQVGGTMGVLTNPVTTSSTVGTVVFTFSGTPVSGQSYTFQVTCGLP